MVSMAQLGVVLLCCAAIALWVLSRVRTRSLVDRWAQENGYAILDQQYRPVNRGPFWMASGGQRVFYVTVRDREGRRRTGYIRCGDLFLGLLSPQVEVRWDEEPPPLDPQPRWEE